MQQDLADLPQVQKLFEISPDHFTSERDAVAKALALDGDARRADAVKALRKPPLSVWAVNQLARKHRPQIEKLFESADRLRNLQSQAGAAAPSSELARATHDLQSQIWNLVQLAKPIVEPVGSALSSTLERRIQSTFQAAALYPGEGRDDVRRGTLSKDLTPPAFTDLISSLPPPPPAGKAISSSTSKHEESKEVAEAERDVKAAELHLEQLERQAQADETNLARSREAVEQAERTAASLRERARALERELKASRARVDEATAKLAAGRKKLQRLARK